MFWPALNRRQLNLRPHNHARVRRARKNSRGTTQKPLPWSSLFIKQNSISSLPDTRNQCYKHTCITIICLQKNPSENLLETRKIGQPKAHRQGKSSLLDLPQSISAWGVISSSSPHPAQQTSTSKSWRLNWALTCKISKKARHATSLHLLASRQSISTLEFLPHTQRHQRHENDVSFAKSLSRTNL